MNHYLELTVDADALDVAVDQLWQHDALAVSEERVGELTTLRAGFADQSTLCGAYEVLAARFDVVVRSADETALDAWRAHARPVRAGRRIVVCPAWLDTHTRDDDIVVRVEPRRTFGLAHATTVGMLAAMEELVHPNACVLDVGSGSGVLAVTAALLGARRVDAVDIDASAREVTCANARRNGVDRVVRVLGADLSCVHDTYDVVVANLLLPVIESLGPALAGAVRAKGMLVLGGLLDGQDERAVAAVAPLQARHRSIAAGWCTLVAARPSAP